MPEREAVALPGGGRRRYHAREGEGVRTMTAAPGSLDGIDLLASLGPAERAALAARCTWRRHAPGERILQRGDEGREVLFLVEGRVRVIDPMPGDREIAFAVVGAGAVLGELSALDGEPRSAAVDAADACLVATLDAGAFNELLLDRGTVAVALLRCLARLIRRNDARIAELCLLGALQRVYRELLMQARPHGSGAGIVSPLPPAESLAASAGTSRDTVTRALHHLAKAGITRRQGADLVIRDVDMLEALIETED